MEDIERGRNQVIDAFRGIAVISVMVFHYLVRFAPPFWVNNLYGYDRTYPSLLGLGSLGVQLFFVISGLVISMTVSHCRSVMEFAVKRFARLYPAFLVAATVTFVAMWFFGLPPLRVGLSDYLANLTMMPANLGYLPVDGAYWSLAVEVKFYFYTAVGFLLLRQQFWKFLLAVGVAGCVAGFSHPHAADDFLIRVYMPLFIFGMAGWLWLLARQHRNALLAGLVGIALYVLDRPDYGAAHSGSLAPHLFVIGGAGLMLLLLWRAPQTHFGLLSRVGRVSYSLYLYHQFIGVTLIVSLVALGVPDLGAAAITALLMIVLAWLSFAFVEEPGRKLIGWLRKAVIARTIPVQG